MKKEETAAPAPVAKVDTTETSKPAAKQAPKGGAQTTPAGSALANAAHTDALKMQQIAKLKILLEQKLSNHSMLAKQLAEKKVRRRLGMEGSWEEGQGPFYGPRTPLPLKSCLAWAGAGEGFIFFLVWGCLWL